MIGVLRDAQGQGCGGKLMDAVHRLAATDPDSAGVCLNTEVTDNVALYEHLGYRILAERDIEGLHTWCMFRPRR
jgi:ribosomal protein S18 acetylase RimI-like enzyme